jgi:hypothetical protein
MVYEGKGSRFEATIATLGGCFNLPLDAFVIRVRFVGEKATVVDILDVLRGMY